MARPFLAAIGLAALVLPSCSAFSETAEDPLWVEHDLSDGPPLRDLLDACVWAVVSSNFPGADRDEVSQTVISNWDEQLYPYSRRGTRSRATVEVVNGAEPRSYRLRVRVQVQVNEEVHLTLDPNAAKWEDSREDETRARLVLEKILARVRPRGGRSGV